MKRQELNATTNDYFWGQQKKVLETAEESSVYNFMRECKSVVCSGRRVFFNLSMAWAKLFVANVSTSQTAANKSKLHFCFYNKDLL